MKDHTVAVIVPTRGRGVACGRTVSGVLSQELPQDWDLRVVVVDNNDEPYPFPFDGNDRVTVVREPVPGIPDARNRGVATALPFADIVAFIDDDEVPVRTDWLATLVRLIAGGRADVATGPVWPEFMVDRPSWIREQRVFQRPNFRDGSLRREAYSGNVAVTAEIFREHVRWFNTEFRGTGGEDTEFFRRVHRGGSRILWASRAAVRESVPADRATVRWVLERSLRIGANRVQFLSAKEAHKAARLLYGMGSVGEVLLLLAAPIAWLASRRHGLALLARAFRGLGCLSAFAGRRVETYS